MSRRTRTINRRAAGRPASIWPSGRLRRRASGASPTFWRVCESARCRSRWPRASTRRFPHARPVVAELTYEPKHVTTSIGLRRHHLPDARSAGPHRRWQLAPSRRGPPRRPRRGRAAAGTANDPRGVSSTATAAGRCDGAVVRAIATGGSAMGRCFEGAGDRVASTDDQGRYELTGLLAGPLHGDGEQGRLRRPLVRADASDRCGQADRHRRRTDRREDSISACNAAVSSPTRRRRIWRPCSQRSSRGAWRSQFVRDIAA